jgi:hypothetical protein
MRRLFTKLSVISVGTVAHRCSIAGARVGTTRAVVQTRIAVAAGESMLTRLTEQERRTLTVEAEQSIDAGRAVRTRIRVAVVDLVLAVVARVAGRADAAIAIDAVLALAVTAVHVLTLVDVEVTVGAGDAGRTSADVAGRVRKAELLTEKRRIGIAKAVQRSIGSFEADAVVVTRTGFALLNVVLAQFALIAGLTVTAEERLQVDATGAVLTRLTDALVDVVAAIATGKAASGTIATIIVVQVDALAYGPEERRQPRKKEGEDDDTIIDF